jgi:hypothetical protein
MTSLPLIAAIVLAVGVFEPHQRRPKAPCRIRWCLNGSLVDTSCRRIGMHPVFVVVGHREERIYREE